jgi:hypothetical protein
MQSNLSHPIKPYISNQTFSIQSNLSHLIKPYISNQIPRPHVVFSTHQIGLILEVITDKDFRNALIPHAIPIGAAAIAITNPVRKLTWFANPSREFRIMHLSKLAIALVVFDPGIFLRILFSKRMREFSHKKLTSFAFRIALYVGGS